MGSYLLFYLLSLAVISSFSPSNSDNPLSSSCARERIPDGDTKFDENLGSLMASLSWSAPITGFANDTSGEGPDRLYGLTLCRGDVSPDRCRTCLDSALTDVKMACPNSEEAIVFYELCMIRYSRNYFFGTPSENFLNISDWQNASQANMVLLNRELGSWLPELVARGASSKNMYVADWSTYREPDKLYAMVQCTRDLTPETCKSCLENATNISAVCCGEKKGAAVYGGSCFFRYDDHQFLNVTLTTGVKNEGNTKVIIAISIATTVASLIAFYVFIWICIRRRRRHRREEIEIEEEDLNETECSHFSLRDLKLATQNFSDKNMLGKGGSGAIYKGVLSDGQVIAVKRLMENSCEGLEELKKEVCLISKLQHRNLVKLLGYCLQSQEKILVYEYLRNKSLDTVLFDPIRSKDLTWDKRVNIIKGIARGLLYLHEDSIMKIIHRDVKASNILLDDGMHPKIGDFGLARAFNNGESYENTMHIAGTCGYIAPEYMNHGEISTKSDVYSFGVLVMEIVSGKKCYDFFSSNPQTDLIKYISWLWEEGDPLNILDHKIRDGAPVEEVLKIIKIGLFCMQHSPRKRPTMSMVVQLLKSDASSLSTVPQRIGFNTRADTFNPSPRKMNKQWNVNEIEFVVTDTTLLEPR